MGLGLSLISVMEEKGAGIRRYGHGCVDAP